MIFSRKKRFHLFMVLSSLLLSFFSPTLQALISNDGVWPGLGFYPITEFLTPEYWLQAAAFVVYACVFYLVGLLVISCGYHSTKVSNFILGWTAGTSVFFLVSWVLDYRRIDLQGDLLYRSLAMGFVALMFGEIVLKKLLARKMAPEEILPTRFVWLCEAFPMFRNE